MNKLNMVIGTFFSKVGFELLDHVHHLQKEYPYLFSLAVRSNPLNPDASTTATA